MFRISLLKRLTPLVIAGVVVGSSPSFAAQNVLDRLKRVAEEAAKKAEDAKKKAAEEAARREKEKTTPAVPGGGTDFEPPRKWGALTGGGGARRQFSAQNLQKPPVTSARLSKWVQCLAVQRSERPEPSRMTLRGSKSPGPVNRAPPLLLF